MHAASLKYTYSKYFVPVLLKAGTLLPAFAPRLHHQQPKPLRQNTAEAATQLVSQADSAALTKDLSSVRAGFRHH